MKLVQSLIVAAVVAVPAVSFAQSNAPLTRALVRAELVQLEKAGYNPALDYTRYPENVQAAEARVSARNHDAASAYGPALNGTSSSGSHASAAQDAIPGLGPLYAHS
ncbi:DUF4148 domain-containing protein [Paraburkholderia kururiensis]|jgi:hypothetical protein|uniref:DUF4148 domain-containing protein n=1 Tax=Paraburkholderia kururiensis TaxID=984307 RepID=A0ABZ0WPA3_9BURK|nr:DUF4148 domain-containing protein [Paraburkholderia kururiensis]WQD79086.1 DUF4148 domain-containing protein [Paraburkholderia kururiensis]